MADRSQTWLRSSAARTFPITSFTRASWAR
jgi:hypothetical protein